ncbi:MAG: tail fiber protein [Bacteroidetes bacterium]|nr:tail fiber protein [Bacteroidota bacterium]
MLGEIKLFAGNFVPDGFLLCDGSVYQISNYPMLFSKIGKIYGGDGISTFGVPNLLGRVPVCNGQAAGNPNFTLGQTGGVQNVTLTANQVGVHMHTGQYAASPQLQINLQIPASTGAASSTSPAGNMFTTTPAGYEMYDSTPPAAGQPVAMPGTVSFTTAQQTGTNTTQNLPHPNDQPYQCINYIIDAFDMYDEPILGEICIFTYNFVPVNFAECNGAMLSTGQSAALYSLLGNVYGSSGAGKFALPDLRGRLAAGADMAHKTNITNRALGQSGGVTSVALSTNQLPPHIHPVQIGTTGKTSWPVTPNIANTANPANAMLAKVGGETMYSTTSNSTMAVLNGGSLTGAMQVNPNTSGNIPHDNVQPVMALCYAICTNGIYPQRP